MFLKKQNTKFVILPCWIILILLLTSCSTSTYHLDSYSQSLVGTYTRDATSLGSVERVALVSFTAQSPNMTDVKYIGPLVDLAYQQALAEMQGQSTLTFIPMETVIENDTYSSMRVELDPKTYSPLEGLTDLPDDFDSLDITGLCDALDVDALLLFHLEYDWDFPTVNAVTMKTKTNVVLIIPPDGKTIWGINQVTWEDTLIPVPASFKLILSNPNEEEWAVIAESASESLKVRALGGAPIFFLAENAAQTH